MATLDSPEPVPEDSRQTGEQADGGDVARDPDVIAREIEQTRAELADTIDAIADRLSPRRAASRGAAAVKSQISAVFEGGSEPPASVLDASPRAAASGESGGSTGPGPGVREVASSGRGTQFTGTSQYTSVRRLRTDRVLLTVGVGAGVAALIVLRRSRH